MSRSLAPIALSVAATIVLSARPGCEARAEHGSGHLMSIDSDGSVAGCAGIHVHFNGVPTSRAEETLTIPRAQARDLILSGSPRGGVTVRGADTGVFTITACKVAAAETQGEAAAFLQKIALRNAGGRISVEGPDEGSWTGFLIVSARAKRTSPSRARTARSPRATFPVRFPS